MYRLKFLVIISLLIPNSCKKGIDSQSLNLSIQSEKLDNQLEIIRLNKQAIQLDPKNYRAFNNLAIAQFKTNKDTSEVFANLRKALEIAPDYDKAFYNLINIYHALNEDSKVISLGEEYLEKKLNNHIVALVGESYNNIENWAEAKFYLERSIKLNPSNPGSFKELGKTQMFLGNLDLAETYLDKAIQIDSNYHQAINRRAIVFSEKGEFQKALQDYNKSISLHASGIYFYNRAILYAEKLQKMEEACNDLQSAIKLSNELALGYYKKHCD
ncbi:tetratricopeptide repeat protein [Portibacter marinus]|uniref:tetratricopeptide repeat protein n=1 Tax=Portibacter marinus TaxID=2898660 RepID=UPI001F39018F|nr:hypothetical protein [Portibacter marinus]